MLSVHAATVWSVLGDNHLQMDRLLCLVLAVDRYGKTSPYLRPVGPVASLSLAVDQYFISLPSLTSRR